MDVSKKNKWRVDEIEMYKWEEGIGITMSIRKKKKEKKKMEEMKKNVEKKGKRIKSCIDGREM